MKNQKPHIRLETWVDLGVCLVILPCLVSIFPVEEWTVWRGGDVVVFLLWVYLCWYLGRHVVPALLQVGKARLWSGIALLFIMTVLTFLMSLRKVPFPQDVDMDHRGFGAWRRPWKPTTGKRLSEATWKSGPPMPSPAKR